MRPVARVGRVPSGGSAPDEEFAGSEALTRFRVLVCVARSDPSLSPAERTALENALAGLELLAHSTPASEFDPKNDVAALLGVFTTRETRESFYRSAVNMVHVAGVCTPTEQKMLDRIHATLQITGEKASLSRRILGGIKDTVLPSCIHPVNDPARRATEVRADILKYSVLGGVLGALAIPGAALVTDVAVLSVQAKLVRDIGQRWGHTVDAQAAASLLGGLGIGTGMRLAVHSLVSLLPVWGSVVGASTSFASTWALGHIADKYFASGMKAQLATLASSFRAAQAAGREAFDAHQSGVDSRRKLDGMAMQTLRASLKAGRITQQEYSERVASPAGPRPA